MKLKTTKNTYDASNFEMYIDENNLRNVWATSYYWWKFATSDSVGNIFFNNTSYSKSTSNHQNNAQNILARLGIVVDVHLHGTYKSLRCSIKAVMESEIECLKRQIVKDIQSIKKKGSWKKTNTKRRYYIRGNLDQIKRLRLIKNEYLDKKRIPFGLQDDRFIVPLNYMNETTVIENKKGKINYHGYNDFIKNEGRRFSGLFHNPQLRFSKIVALLDIKSNQSKFEFGAYRFTSDLDGMIPEIDTPEYITLKKWLKRMDINGRNFNAFKLEKIHTYLVNKENRKSYTPREVVNFPYNKLLDIVERHLKHCQIIRTDKELRAEGRKQSHCIGSKQYQDKLRKGYNALHFKGHTFFLTPDLDLIAAHGRHNSTTPGRLIMELRQAIKNAKNQDDNLQVTGIENEFFSYGLA